MTEQAKKRLRGGGSGWRRRLVAGLVAALSLAAGAGPTRAQNLVRTVEMIKPSIVGVGTDSAIRTPSVELMGTGFVVADGRHVITNDHVVPQLLDAMNRERLIIITGYKTQYRTRGATVVALDPEHDLALLKMSGPPLPSVKLGSGELLPEGSNIGMTGFPIGNIMGFYRVTHRGIVSAVTPIRCTPSSQAGTMSAAASTK